MGLAGCDGAAPGALPPSGASLECRTGNCGDARLRSAIPTRGLVKVDFGRAAAPGALLDLSPYFVETEDHIAGINEVIEAVFDDLEYVAGETVVDEGTEHSWRGQEGDTDLLLEIDEVGTNQYDLAYYEGPAGFDPELDGTAPIISGQVTLQADEDYVSNFELLLDLDALSDVDPDVDATGQIMIGADGDDDIEVRFDASNVSFDGEAPENSLTTYWVFAENDYALEFLSDEVDEVDAFTTVYVRWNDQGGRWDSHAEINDPAEGLLDVIVTNCWDSGASELFAGHASIEASGDFYGELDGDEASCLFGPVDGHPDPGTDFDNLPQEGEWDAIEFLGCDPLDDDCDASCDTDDDCEAEEVCEANLCVEHCTVDEDCDLDEVCDAGVCEEDDSCDDDADCELDEACEAGLCVADDDDCTVDADCELDEVCDAGLCVADDECTIDDDCAIDEICDAGACVPDDECVIDDDCAIDEICDAGSCVPGT